MMTQNYRTPVRAIGVLAYTMGVTQWLHKDGDRPLNAVMAPDFFADAADMMSVGDTILCVGSDGVGFVAVAEVGPERVVVVPLRVPTVGGGLTHDLRRDPDQ